MWLVFDTEESLGQNNFGLKMREMEDNFRKKQILKNSIPIVTELLTCTALEAETFDMELPADLGCDKPDNPSRMADFGQVEYFNSLNLNPCPGALKLKPRLTQGQRESL